MPVALPVWKYRWRYRQRSSQAMCDQHPHASEIIGVLTTHELALSPGLNSGSLITARAHLIWHVRDLACLMLSMWDHGNVKGIVYVMIPRSLGLWVFGLTGVCYRGFWSVWCCTCLSLFVTRISWMQTSSRLPFVYRIVD